MDLLQDGVRRRQAQARPAVLLRDQHRQEARLGQRAHELGRIGALAIQLPPVLAGEAVAQLADGVTDFRKGFVGVQRVCPSPQCPKLSLA